MTIVKLGIVVLVVVALHGGAAADDEVGHVCVRNARYMTCPDGSTVDVCDGCAFGGGGSDPNAYDPNRPKMPIQRFSAGLLGGPSYTLADDSADPAKGFGGGLEAAMLGGGRPAFGLLVSLGMRAARTIDRTTGEGTPRFWLPVQVGLNISPRMGPRSRLQLGASGGMAFGLNEHAQGAFIYDLWAGFAFYGKTDGVGIDVVHSGMSGDVHPPIAFLRFSFLHRNKELEW